MWREVTRHHLDDVGVVKFAQHLQLVLGVVMPHPQGEELGGIHLLGALVEAIVHHAKLTSGGGGRDAVKGD